MVKLIYSSAFDSAVDVAMRIIQDPAVLTKSASTVFGCDYSQLAPDKDHVGIHLTALGAFERYGSNRNGDSFPKQACIRYHDTFVKHGSVFRHHRNKDRAKALGNIKASAYNPGMDRIELFIHAHKDKCAEELARLEKDGESSFSMACKVAFDRCYPADTQVLTNNGFVPIERVRAGDTVFTHQRNWRQVTAVHNNAYTGGMITVDSHGIPAFDLTANHPIFAIKRDVLHSAAGRRYTLRSGTNTAEYYGKDLGDITAHICEMRADELEAGDYLVTPMAAYSDNVASARDQALAYVLGRYAGDGSLITRRRGRKHKGEPYIVGVSFSCDADDASIAWLRERLELVTDKPVHVYPAGSGKAGAVVVVSDRDLAVSCLDYAGAGWADKRIPVDWETREEALSCLAGCIDADGSYDSVRGLLRLCAGSRTLVYGAWKLGVDCGLFGSLHRENKCVDGSDGGFRRSQDHTWVACWGASFASQLGAHCYKASKCCAPQYCKYDTMQWGNYVVRRITGLTSRAVDNEDVYNLTVADDATYVAACVSTHNCNICDTVRKNGADPNQCDHIRYELGKVYDDGKVACTHNDEPDFFDISFVGRPADRIAWSLKVASGGVMDSVKLAEAEGLWVPDYMAIESADGLAKLAHLRRIVELQDMLTGFGSGANVKTASARYFMELVKAADVKLADADIERLRQYEPADVFTAMAKVGTVLDVRSFFKYALGPQYSEIEPIVGDVAAAVPLVMRDAVKAGDCQRMCNDATFDGASPYRCTPLRIPADLYMKVAEASFVGRVVDERVINATLDRKIVKIAVDTGASIGFNTHGTVGLAEKYAAYKLAAVKAVLEFHKDTDVDSVLALAAAQNLIA